MITKKDIKIGQRVCFMSWFNDEYRYARRLDAIGTIVKIAFQEFYIMYDDGQKSQNSFGYLEHLELAP